MVNKVLTGFKHTLGYAADLKVPVNHDGSLKKLCSMKSDVSPISNGNKPHHKTVIR